VTDDARPTHSPLDISSAMPARPRDCRHGGAAEDCKTPCLPGPQMDDLASPFASNVGSQFLTGGGGQRRGAIFTGKTPRYQLDRFWRRQRPGETRPYKGTAAGLQAS
jgi:hypothetical protein